MKGYYKNPAATSQCIDSDGWLHTGDLGYFDRFGFFFIVDRMKEVIKYKGFQVGLFLQACHKVLKEKFLNINFEVKSTLALLVKTITSLFGMIL